jgi:predicted permease
VDLVLATPSLFPLLGVRPLVGRGFGPDAVGGKAVLLSYGLWQRRYGGDASLIGRTIEVNGVARMVAGVMPADFRFPHPRIDLWMDLGVRGGAGTLDSFHYQGLARLHDGVTVERATADLRRLIATLDVPGAGVAGVRESLMPIVQPLRDYVVRDVRSMLWLLFGAMAFVLLIVSANVANLHLVRASAREREVVVRAALGAGRGQLMRPFIAESVLLAALGGGLGLLVGWAAVRALAAMAVVNVPRLDEVSVDARVIAFGIVLSLGTGVVLGLVPAARVVRTGLAGGLRSAGRAFTASRERRRTQHALVIVQVAIALTLLIGSALMVQTLWRLRTTDPGFDTRDLLTFEVILPYGGYETYEKSARLQLALLDRVRALPDVVSAGAVSGLPMAASEFPELPVEVRVFGEADAGAGDRQVRYRLVADGYFETMRIAIVEGRVPERTYHGAGGAPALINSSLAKKLFPNQTALGKRVRRLRPERSTEEERWNTIVGVVADVKHDGLAEPAPGMVYLPILDTTAEPGNSPGFLTFALRMNGPTLALVPAIRRIVQELDPALPIANVRSMQDIVDAATARTTFTTLLLGVATVAALFLGVIGIYGVLSYAVGLRRREMGLRMALGARAQEVVRLVLRDGLRLTVLGLLLGTIAAASLTRIMHGMLYGVSPTDPATFASTATVLFTVALFACVLPALRAARVQPVEALADE